MPAPTRNQRFYSGLLAFLMAVAIGSTASPASAGPTDPPPGILPPILTPVDVARYRNSPPDLDAAYCQQARHDPRSFTLSVRGTDIRDPLVEPGADSRPSPVPGLRLQVWTTWAGGFNAPVGSIDGVTSYVASYAALPKPTETGFMVFQLVDRFGATSSWWVMTVYEDGECDLSPR